MNLNKIKSIIHQFSETPKVKKLIDDVQSASQEIQTKLNSKLHQISADDAVKKYKELMKKISAKEDQLQKEINQVLGKVKKSANDVEKNLDIYKKKAKLQRQKLETVINAKLKKVGKAKPSSTVAKSSKKAKKAVKKVSPKKTARKK